MADKHTCDITTAAHNQSPYYSVSSILLLFLFIGDVVFIVMHCAYLTFHIINDSLDSVNLNLLIDTDQGYAEFFQYGKLMWITAVLAFVGFKARQFVLFSWFFFFLYLFIDDAFSIHENAGLSVANYYGLVDQFGLRQQDFGELAVSAFFGILFFMVIGITTIRATFPYKTISIFFVLLILLLAFFGVGIDMLHIIIDNVTNLPGRVYILFTVIEDGGEMVVLSLICWFVMKVYRSHNNKFKDYKLPFGLGR